MIKLHKGAAPEILTDNATTWTVELLQEIAAGGDQVAYRKGKYNKPSIKDAIKKETNCKCAYCEAQPLHVTYGDIEHIIPKSIQPELTFDWENLTLACDVCNTKKGNQEGLLDPYDCEPSEEFAFYGPMILHIDRRAGAELTRTILDLNRIELLSKRKDRIDALANLFRRLETHPDDYERELLIRASLAHETKDESEFAACARSYLTNAGYHF